MRTSYRILTSMMACGLTASATPAFAAKVEPVAITFRPTTRLDAAAVMNWRSIHTLPVTLVVEDGLTESNHQSIGQRKWPVGRPYELKPTTDLAKVIGLSLPEYATSWGLLIKPEAAPHTLLLTLTSVHVYERLRATGLSSYTGNASIELVLQNSDGAELWSGEASDETHRFGRAESDENTSEVICDAVVRSLAALLRDLHLQTAWVDSAEESMAAEQGASPMAAEVLSPHAALEQITVLMAADYSEDTLTRFVAGIILERPLGAEDLLAWKAAGVPEDVVQQLLLTPHPTP